MSGACCTFEPDQHENLCRITPAKERKCTDCLFFLLFIAFWGATIYLLSYSIDDGADINRVIRGVDMYGRVCGKDDGVKDKPLAAWPAPGEYDPKICVSSCNQTQTNDNIAEKHQSSEFLYYCIPTVSVNGSINVEMSGDFQSFQESFSRAIGDLYTARHIIGASVGVAIIFAFFYLLFIRGFAGVLVWSVILGLILGGTFVTWSFLNKAEVAETDEAEADPDRAKNLRYIAYTVGALTLVFTVVIIGMRTRIKIAIEVIKEASRAMGKMPSLVLFPIFPLIFAIGYFTFWIIMALYLYSVANVAYQEAPAAALVGVNNTNPANMTIYERDEEYNNAIWFHFFGLLWNLQFIIYFTFMVIAGAIAEWYFTPKDKKGNVIYKKTRANQIQPQSAWDNVDLDKYNEFSSTPVLDSVGRTLRYHTGSIAFGSLILAVINFVRAIVYYLEETCGGKENRLQRCVFCMIGCCLWCFECCADKLSKNAFVWCAIWGDNFVASASGAFELLWANLSRVAAINMVGAYLMFLGKLLVAAATCGAAAATFMYVDYYREKLSSPVVPCIVIFLLAYCIANLFMIVYETTIDTIFLCFLVDAEYNKHTGTMFAPESLKALIGAHRKESERIATNAYHGRNKEAPSTNVESINNSDGNSKGGKKKGGKKSKEQDWTD